MKKKKGFILIGVAVAVILLAVILYRVFGEQTSASEGSTAYVEEVANLMDTGMIGMVNQYAGVIESQESWSVNQNAEVSVQEIKVSVGDEVRKGDVLFVYSTEKYEADLAQANIDLERLQNEVTTIQSTIDQLTADKSRAAASEQANYTIQIQEQQLQLQEKELDIQSKQLEIEKLNSNIANAEVTSAIDGVVKSINDGSSVSTDSSDTSFLTVMKTGDFRVKGNVNEQNVGALYEGMQVIVHSRVDADQIWNGTITKIDTENANSGQSGYYGYDSADSTSYPFYVELDSSEGLMLGQHVYLEPAMDEAFYMDKSEGIWIGSYYVVQEEDGSSYVWAVNSKGKLEQRTVTLGETDAYFGEVQILEGLSETDQIAIPDASYEAGMATAPMSEMYTDMTYDDMTYDDAAYTDEGFYEEDLYEEDSYEDAVTTDEVEEN